MSLKAKVICISLPVLGAAIVVGSGFSVWTFTTVNPASISGSVTVDSSFYSLSANIFAVNQNSDGSISSSESLSGFELTLTTDGIECLNSSTSSEFSYVGVQVISDADSVAITDKFDVSLTLTMANTTSGMEDQILLTDYQSVATTDNSVCYTYSGSETSSGIIASPTLKANGVSSSNAVAEITLPFSWAYASSFSPDVSSLEGFESDATDYSIGLSIGITASSSASTS